MKYPLAAPLRVHLPARRLGFTLLELLVSMAVISIFVLLLFSVTDNSFKLWRSTQSSIAMFDEARAAFDTMSRRLSQATVNTYLDYYDSNWTRRQPNNAAFVPARYGRASDLHFLSGPTSQVAPPAFATNHPGHGVFFFAPLGYTDSDPNYADLPNLLNACGYYVEWGSDAGFRPSFLSPLPVKHRFRLIENILPSQNFKPSSSGGNDNGYPAFTDPAGDDYAWVSTSLAGNPRKHVLADNIIALIIRPEVPEQDANSLGLTGKEGITSDYLYDSRAGRGSEISAAQFAQLPPMLRVIMVAISEKDAARLINGTTPPDALKLKNTWFTDPTKLDTDLKALSDQLAAAGVQFRIFNQVIALRAAKFSAQKEK